jgi:ribosomal protein L34E
MALERIDALLWKNKPVCGLFVVRAQESGSKTRSGRRKMGRGPSFNFNPKHPRHCNMHPYTTVTTPPIHSAPVGTPVRFSEQPPIRQAPSYPSETSDRRSSASSQEAWPRLALAVDQPGFPPELLDKITTFVASLYATSHSLLPSPLYGHTNVRVVNRPPSCFHS